MGTQETTKETQNKIYGRQENHSFFLLDFMSSCQDLTFSTRIKDGTPRGNQREEQIKCLTGAKSIASFY